MDLPSLTTPGSHRGALVPRRPMRLHEALTARLLESDGLPAVDLEGLMPVKSMFDYDTSSAFVVTELPPHLD